jgi:hypothetical protein
LTLVKAGSGSRRVANRLQIVAQLHFVMAENYV